MIKKLSILFFLGFLNFFSYSGTRQDTLKESGAVEMFIEAEIDIGEEEQTTLSRKRPNPILVHFRQKQKKNKRITAAVLAFPFPFGIVGLHRIYLGSAPYVPVVYIASLGGAFGILPFIDFCTLLLDKDIDRFTNNDKVFMWVK